MSTIIKWMLPLLVCSGSFFLSAQSYDWQYINSTNSGLPENTVHCIKIDSNGDFWIGTDLGLAFFDGSNWIIYNTENSPLLDNSIRALEFDADGVLWIGTTQSGIHTFDGVNWNSYNPTNSDLPDFFIRAITRDLTGDMWVGTVEGLARFNGATWDVWTIAANGLNSNNITSIAVDASNKKIIGTINGGLIYFENEILTEYTILEGGIPDNSCIEIAFDEQNNPWFASPSGGLFRDNGTQTWTTYNVFNSLIPSNALTAIQFNESNDFFIGTMENGLIRFQAPDTWQNFTTSNSAISDNHILCIEKYNSGTFWIGTKYAGIFTLKESTESITEVNITANVYPNPFTDELTIQQINNLYSIEIIDQLGKIIISSSTDEFKQPNIKVSTTLLNPGSYFLVLKTTDSIITQLIQKR